MYTSPDQRNEKFCRNNGLQPPIARHALDPIINALSKSHAGCMNWTLRRCVCCPASVPEFFKYIASCVTFLDHVWGMRSCDIWTRLLLHNSGEGGAHVVVQPHGSGGFGVVSVQFKVWALHVQWVRRFVTSFSRWMQFLSLPRVPSRPLGSLWSWVLSLVSLLLRLPKLPPSRCTLFL